MIGTVFHNKVSSKPSRLYRLTGISFRSGMVCQRSQITALLLKLAGGTLDFVHDAQEIAAPELFDLRFRVATADQLRRHVDRFAGVVPADYAAAAIEVG